MIRSAFGLGVDGNYNEDQIDDLIMLMLDPKQGIKQSNFHKGNSKILIQCFSGADATEWIQNAMEVDKKTAVQKGQRLMNRGIFHSLDKSHTSFHAKSDIYYRFNVDHFRLNFSWKKRRILL